MRRITLTTLAAALLFAAPTTASEATVTIHADQGKYKINKEIYGQFAEHLGSCIYGGLWVGPDSPIPNTDGYRSDVVEALRRLQVPVL